MPLAQEVTACDTTQERCGANFQEEIAREKIRMEMLLDIFGGDRKMRLCLTVDE